MEKAVCKVWKIEEETKRFCEVDRSMIDPTIAGIELGREMLGAGDRRGFKAKFIYHVTIRVMLLSIIILSY